MTHVFYRPDDVVAAVLSGRRRFEYCELSGVPINEGDIIELVAFDRNTKAALDMRLRRRVTYVQRAPEGNVPAGFCIVSLTAAT